MKQMRKFLVEETGDLEQMDIWDQNGLVIGQRPVGDRTAKQLPPIFNNRIIKP